MTKREVLQHAVSDYLHAHFCSAFDRLHTLYSTDVATQAHQRAMVAVRRQEPFSSFQLEKWAEDGHRCIT